ncbi:MAG TPA: sigma-70 family RNA polymerase sigma factor [Planctomycetota bacterium]
MIQRAAGDDAEARDRAWIELIERYREPVDRAVRRHAGGGARADELAADFFTYLFEKKVLPKVDPDQGRFRCFVQGVVRNYVRNASRVRRADRAEALDSVEFSLGRTERGYEQEEQRDWAQAVLAVAIESLRKDYERDTELLLRVYGIEPHQAVPRPELAVDAGLTENALNVAIHRARARLGERLVAEVRATVASAQDLEEEARLVHEHLLSAYPGLIGDATPGLAAG